MKIVTALYRTHDVATRVRNDVISLGVSEADADIVCLHSMSEPDAMERLHGYDLPEDDVRTYQHAVRNGDHLVVARVHDEHLEATQGVMRDPDHAVPEDELRARYAGEQLIAPAGKPVSAVGSTSNIGAADDGRQTYADPMESGAHKRRS